MKVIVGTNDGLGTVDADPSDTIGSIMAKTDSSVFFLINTGSNEQQMHSGENLSALLENLLLSVPKDVHVDERVCHALRIICLGHTINEPSRPASPPGIPICNPPIMKAEEPSRPTSPPGIPVCNPPVMTAEGPRPVFPNINFVRVVGDQSPFIKKSERPNPHPDIKVEYIDQGEPKYERGKSIPLSNYPNLHPSRMFKVKRERRRVDLSKYPQLRGVYAKEIVSSRESLRASFCASLPNSAKSWTPSTFPVYTEIIANEPNNAGSHSAIKCMAEVDTGADICTGILE